MPVNKGAEYIVLDAIAGTAADLTFDAGDAVIGSSTSGKLTIPYKRIIKSAYKKQAKVAETAQVSTGTPTAANSTYYWVTITQNVVDGKNYTNTYSYESDATATATEICDGIRNAINKDAQVKVTASGTTTLILTADTGYSQFLVSCSTNISMAATTPGVYAKNTGQILYDAGFTSVTTTNNYTSYTYVVEVLKPASNPGEFASSRQTYIVFLNEGDGDCAALVTAMDNMATADDGSGVANPNAIAIA